MYSFLFFSPQLKEMLIIAHVFTVKPKNMHIIHVFIRVCTISSIEHFFFLKCNFGDAKKKKKKKKKKNFTFFAVKKSYN